MLDFNEAACDEADRLAEMRDSRLPFLPTRAEIAEATAQIRENWDGTRRRRTGREQAMEYEPRLGRRCEFDVLIKMSDLPTS